MDIIEKKVVRRKTPVIAQSITFEGPLASAAIKQGILTKEKASQIMLEESNAKRITNFLRSLEDLPGPKLAFEKLCYLLEHQGYTCLCDELWVELICAKGNLNIDPAVYAEAKILVREKLDKKCFLSDADMEELTLLMATRYQVAKETFRRQTTRQSRHIALDKAAIEQDIRGLCSQIDVCMTMYPRTRADGEALPCQRQPEMDDLPRRSSDGNSSIPAASLEKNKLTNWVQSLRSKIDHLTHAYVTHVVNSEQKQEPEEHITDEDDLTLELHLPQDSSDDDDDDDRMDSAFYDDIADKQMKERRKRNKLRRDLTSHIRLPRYIGRRSSTERATEVRKPNKQHHDILAKYTIKRRRAVISQDDNKAKGKRKSTKPERLRNMADVCNSFVKIKFDLTKDQRDKTENDIRKDIEELRKQHSVLRSRSHLDKTTEVENIFWQKRAESMRKSRSVGYYYFLSEFKRKRCLACAASPEVKTACAWDYRARPEPSIKLPMNLYPNRNLASLKVDDADCPGAIIQPGMSQKRCLACAYANQDLTRFYDAVVAPDGSRHFEYPRLDSIFSNTAILPTQ